MHGDDGDENEADEEQLRAMIAEKALAEDEDEDDVDEGEGSDASPKEDMAHLSAASVEEIAQVSAKLSEFVAGQRAGRVDLPQPFPASEWTHIFVAACTEDSRFMELQSTWANLRVLIAENFGDLQTGDNPAADPDAVSSALRKAHALHAATGLPALAETTCCHVAALGSKPPSETLYRMDDTVSELPAHAPRRPTARSSTNAAAYVDDNCAVIGEGDAFPAGSGVAPRRSRRQLRWTTCSFAWRRGWGSSLSAPTPSKSFTSCRPSRNPASSLASRGGACC